jgi:hypothetical protein
MTIFNIPRNERSPETEVDVLLTNLSALYSELKPDTAPYEFINTFFKEFYECENTSGDVLAKEHLEKTNEVLGKSVYGVGRVTELAALVIACAYCCQAQRAFNDGWLNEAWTFIVDARKWCDFAIHRSMRVSETIEIDRISRTSRVRSKIVSENKNKKYREKQIDFINKMYVSRAWGDKVEATSAIANALSAYVIKHNLPVENVKCVETGISSPKEDWTRFVKNVLPSSAQIKIDALNFKSTAI